MRSRATAISASKTKSSAIRGPGFGLSVAGTVLLIPGALIGVARGLPVAS